MPLVPLGSRGSCLPELRRTSTAGCASIGSSPRRAAAGEAILAARSRDRAGAERIVERIRSVFGAAASYRYAEVYAHTGDADRAFAELNNAVRAKDPGLQKLKRDPFLDGIVRDPRFAALLQRLKFP